MGGHYTKFAGLTEAQVRSAILTDDTKFAGANIDMKVSQAGIKPTVEASGSITADGTEQQVAELTSADPVRFSGWINLNNMDTGDKVTIKTYYKDQAGVYRNHATEIYEDALTQPMAYIVPLTASACRITLQQTAGTYRSFDYCFYKE